MIRPSAILTDIEGTTTPIAFVRDTLFPYARFRLAGFLEQRGHEPAVAELIAESARMAEGRPVLDALLAWMDQDAKVTPLKALQGLIWDKGYASGDLLGRIYPDVPPILRRWRAQGIRLYVYSSGSEAAQRLIFRHSDAGDLSALFSGFFDTGVGAKRAPASYTTIARGIGLPAAELLFLSDMEPELDAAALAGLSTCQVVRSMDGTVASENHPVAADFSAIQAILG